ncbi:MAG TPA: HD domain-containing protein [Mycobacterium sp.]|nr:HD domain-containing protein [Mycobacterium sp.]
MTETIAGVAIPDTVVVKAATDLVLDADTELLFHHSRRVYLWGMLKSRRRGLSPDPELTYVGAMFHDLGLTPKYRTRHQRFEVDGADMARQFLLDQGYSSAEARMVWLSIALHTTPGIPEHLEPEVHLVTLGVETDVLGQQLNEITEEQRAAVTAAHPRPDFKNRIQHAFYEGMKDRPETTFGTMNDDVLAHFDPHFNREDFVNIIAQSGWPE